MHLWWLLVYFRASGFQKVRQWRSLWLLKSSTRPPALKPTWSSWTWVFIWQQFVSVFGLRMCVRVGACASCKAAALSQRWPSLSLCGIVHSAVNSYESTTSVRACNKVNRTRPYRQACIERDSIKKKTALVYEIQLYWNPGVIEERGAREFPAYLCHLSPLSSFHSPLFCMVVVSHTNCE